MNEQRDPGRPHQPADDAIESRAAIGRHPLHPMMVTFPIAALTGAALTDIAYLTTGTLFWSEASWWLLLVGVITGLVAAALGAIDYFGIPRVRAMKTAGLHAAGNAAALLTSLLNLGLRWDEPAAIGTPALLLSVIVAVMLGITGWLGGELSYRHRVGVIPKR